MAASFIDLRSDTVTQPTPQMRQAAFEASVGDDGMGEDPTVGLLEERFAARVGKQAAVFVPSGVMANQIALRILSKPGDTIASGRRQHVVGYELGGLGETPRFSFRHSTIQRDASISMNSLKYSKATATTFPRSPRSLSRTRTWLRGDAPGLLISCDDFPR